MPDTLHVIPNGDLVDHESADTCACGPTSDPVTRVDGSAGWVVRHHALDGRENNE